MKHLPGLSQKILHLALAAAILLCLYAAIGPSRTGEAYIGDFSAETFNQGWVCTTDDGQTEVTLPDILDGTRGEKVVLENTLPETISDGMRLCVRASMEDVGLYILQFKYFT